MSALTDYQAGQTFPAISTTMLAAIAAGLNPTDTAAVGGPPPSARRLSAIVDALVALDKAVNG
jgi:hypothetical protein